MKSVKSIEEIRRKELSSIVDICTKPWETAVEPVQVAPHVYYAGNSWVGVFWIATKDGIILLDAGMPHDAVLRVETAERADEKLETIVAAGDVVMQCRCK